MSRLSVLLAVAVAGALASSACSTTPTPMSELSKKETALPFELPPPSNRCVRMDNVRGFSVIDERHLVIDVSANRAVLVKLFSRCSGLRFASRIGVASRDGELCGYRSESIVIPGGVATRCSVASLHEGRRGQFTTAPAEGTIEPGEVQEEMIEPESEEGAETGAEEQAPD